MGRVPIARIIRVACAVCIACAMQTPSAAYAADTFEPNNDLGSAYNLAESGTVNSYIYTDTDVDWYKFTVTQTSHIWLYLVVPAGENYNLRLYDANGSELEESLRSGDAAEDICYTILHPGTYYAKVTGASGNQTTPYALSLANPKVGDTLEPNATLDSAAGPLLDGTPITSYVFTSNDEDWYSVGISSPSHISLRLDTPTGIDCDLFLYDANQDRIAYSAVDGDTDEAIDYTLQEPGTYYVLVDGGQAGYYSSMYSLTLPYTLTASGDAVSLCTRIAGDDRIDTAVRVSRRAFPAGSPFAIVATARNYPDALSGAVLAQAYNAPLLLTEPDDAPGALEDEIDRLGVRDVYILGGVGAVSADVAEDLADTDTLVHRISGANRFETARLISEEVVRRKGAKPTTAIVATGRNFADALAASPYAANKAYPILLTEPTALSGDTTKALRDMGVTKVFVMGGATAVSSAVENSIKSLGITTQRVYGATRVDTAVAMARIGVAEGMTMSRPMLATGYNFPDALAGGVLGARLGSPLLLTKPAELSAATSAYMAETKTGTGEIVILGGYNAVSLGTQASVDAIY